MISESLHHFTRGAVPAIGPSPFLHPSALTEHLQALEQRLEQSEEALRRVGKQPSIMTSKKYIITLMAYKKYRRGCKLATRPKKLRSFKPWSHHLSSDTSN